MHSDVFISYSRSDLTAAEGLEQALSAAGLAVWRDKNEIRPGGSFPDDIAAAIDSCFAVVWLASASSVQSTWVRRELAYAMDAKKLIVPVHLNREVPGQMPPGLRLLFPHIDYVNLEEQDWDRGVAVVVQSLRDAGVRSGRLTLSEPPAVQVSALPPAASDWPEEVGAVETPAGLDLLPIDGSSPLVLGVVIDVSGSMQTAIQNDGKDQRNRLEGVLDAVRSLACRYRAESALPEVASGTELAELFAYGFGFADRAEKYGKLGALAQRIIKEAPPIPSRIFRGAVRDLLEIAGLESHTLSLKEIDARWSEIERGLWEQRMDLFGRTQMRAAMEAVAERFAAEFASYAGTPHSALFLVSDGESKDGSPLEACRRIARQGTVILSCYLTDQDVAEPRRLYARPQPGWPEGAVTLFRCSSALQEDSLLLPMLREKGWTAFEGDRLFIQLNQSALMSEFVSFVLDLAPKAKPS
ncbi:MAG TPA: toll/interleukin-1 receptor domain-containing protein [Thermoanaerobaculia bacterium]|nr:toll/interleukin-1 receptor domain-containing protein [Thermoanaerobaculia bacterium]